jgi:N-methylhydantoinase A
MLLSMGARIGIDTGGTFNDLVLVDDTGSVRTVKVPSTPADPARAVDAGLERMAEARGAEQVVVGTTVATNAVLQRRGPRVVFITNDGFTDVPFVGRMDKERLYDLHWEKPKPLVERCASIGVAGRVNHHGDVMEQLDEGGLDELRHRLEPFRSEDVVVAVCLLFAYLRPEHERAVRAVVEEVLPGVEVSLSHEVSPVWREYERASTTIADAFVKPIVAGYVDGVGEIVSRRSAAARWNLLASNGGYLRAQRARSRPSQLLLSGLAGGVIGGSFYAAQAGYADVFTLDMGGTSCDIGLVTGGSQQYASEFALSFGIPVSIPCVAVQTIGAGGGSIGWIDKGGLLHVGPESAGAEPGPVAYGHGGTRPTLTDANLVLGRLSPGYFLGGEMTLDLDAAREALVQLGSGLDLSAEQAALAAVRTADENMANAIRLIAVDRGIDPREFALIAFGGAGPLHARAVAERLEIGTLLVPPHPGLCSAFGAAIAEARVDRVKTHFLRSDGADLDALGRAERELRAGAISELAESVDAAEPLVERSADMRYAGQNYELEVPLPDGDLDRAGFAELLERFGRRHHEQYGFRLSDEVVELTHLRVTARRAELTPRLQAPEAAGAAPVAERVVWFGPQRPLPCPVHRREALAAGARVAGPAVIEEADSTTLLHPGDELVVHDSGVLVITIAEGAS